MKKICMFVAASLMFGILKVYADEMKVVRNIDSESFTISGTATPGSVARALVTVPGKTYSDAVSIQNPFDIIKYQNETDVSEDGNFIFEIELSAESGAYTAYVAVGDKVNEVKLEYINPDNYPTLINGLNETADIENYIEQKREDLGFFLDLYDSVNKTAVCNMIEKKLPLEGNDIEECVAIFNSAVIATAVSERKINGISGYADKIDILNDNSKSCKWYQFVNASEVDGRIMGSFDSIENFENALCEAIVLSVVKNPDGYLNVKNVIMDFSNEIGIQTPALTDEVYKKLAGIRFNSYSDLKNAYYANLAINNIGSSSGASGGSSGSSNSSGSAFVPNVSITKEPLSPIVKKHFTDMQVAAWAEEACEYLATNNILSGKAEGIFAPLDMVTREEFITIIVKAFEFEKYVDNNVFDDISADDWCYEYVLAAEQNDITDGIGNNLFGKGENITRQDIASMLYRVINSDNIKIKSDVHDTTFIDEDEIANYAKEAVNYLSARGIINGMGDGRFCGREYATRAQAAQIVYNTLKNMEVGI